MTTSIRGTHIQSMMGEQAATRPAGFSHNAALQVIEPDRAVRGTQRSTCFPIRLFASTSMLLPTLRALAVSTRGVQLVTWRACHVIVPQLVPIHIPDTGIH